MFVLFFRIMF